MMLGCNGRAPLLNTVSGTALTILLVDLAIGVALSPEARAGAGTVNPVQTSTYVLGTHNPTTFGAGTNINAASNMGVFGGYSSIWTVANYGSIRGSIQGIHLASSGSAVTNWGTIGGTGATAIGVLLPGGALTNESSGSI